MGKATAEQGFLIGGKVYWATNAVKAAEIWGEEAGDWNKELEDVDVAPLEQPITVRLVYTREVTATGRLK